MTVELTILIVITSAGLITSLLGPLVTGFVEFSKRIERSSCCGGSSIELTHINEMKQELKAVQSQHQIQIEDLKKVIEKQA